MQNFKMVIVLFVIGLLLEIIAFFVGYADNIPLIFRFVSPSYFKAKKGLQALEETKELSKSNEGFSEIVDVTLRELNLFNPSENLVNVSIIKIILSGNPGLAFSKKGVRPKTPITVEFSDGQKPQWDIESLTNRVNELKNKDVFKFAVVVFFSGIVIQVIGFVIDKAVSK